MKTHPTTAPRWKSCHWARESRRPGGNDPGGEVGPTGARSGGDPPLSQWMVDDSKRPFLGSSPPPCWGPFFAHGCSRMTTPGDVTFFLLVFVCHPAPPITNHSCQRAQTRTRSSVPSRKRSKQVFNPRPSACQRSYISSSWTTWTPTSGVSVERVGGPLLTRRERIVVSKAVRGFITPGVLHLISARVVLITEQSVGRLAMSACKSQTLWMMIFGNVMAVTSGFTRPAAGCLFIDGPRIGASPWRTWSVKAVILSVLLRVPMTLFVTDDGFKGLPRSPGNLGGNDVINAEIGSRMTSFFGQDRNGKFEYPEDFG